MTVKPRASVPLAALLAFALVAVAVLRAAPVFAQSPVDQAADASHAASPAGPPEVSDLVPSWAFEPPVFRAESGHDADALDLVLVWLTDGIVLLVLVAAGITFVLVRQLRDAPRRIPLALVAIAIAGALVRLAVARDAPLNAFAFQRVLPLASAVMYGPVLTAISRVVHMPFYLTDVVSFTNFALACLSPFVFFAHARYLLRDDRSALAAAFLLAMLPMHVRFSRSDVQFIASLLTSSLTFVVLYGALTDRSKRYASACFVILPLLSLATYLSRPENIIFAVLDVGAILLYANRDVPRERRWLAATLVSIAALWSAYTNLFVRFSHNVRDGLQLRTLGMAVTVLFDPRRNTVFNPAMTPPGVGLLALVGLVHLWRSGEKRRAIFLATWFSVFFVVHSYVFPPEPMMMARYHLHLVSPLLLLAAAATPVVLTWRPVWQRVAFAYACTWPVLYLRFERDTAFSEMNEYAFLRSVRDTLPRDCDVLEFVPATSPMQPRQLEASRVARLTTALTDGRIDTRVRVHRLARFEGTGPFGDADAETITPSARALLRAPSQCLVLYEGLTCRTHHPAGAVEAPACTEALALLGRSTVIAQRGFGARRYDDPNVGRLLETPHGTHSVVGVTNGTPVVLTMRRAVSGP